MLLIAGTLTLTIQRTLGRQPVPGAQPPPV
jgi:hypothetical protein